MNIYETTMELKAISQALEEAEDQPDQSAMLSDLLSKLQMNFAAKMIALTQWLLNMKADEEALDAEIRRLQDRKKRIKNRADNLRAWMKFNLESIGAKAFDAGIATLSLRKNPSSVIVSENAKLDAWPPNIFQQCVKVTLEPRKTELKKLPKEVLESLEGVSLSEESYSLQVR